MGEMLYEEKINLFCLQRKRVNLFLFILNLSIQLTRA